MSLIRRNIKLLAPDLNRGGREWYPPSYWVEREQNPNERGSDLGNVEGRESCWEIEEAGGFSIFRDFEVAVSEESNEISPI